ncbi:MAG: PAS domain-containing protein [Halothiobacillaceae bacterium]|jgi:PAS domain S-box-containing protein|nr:PAS domain-containing protein [Halothiobacillaceae bacterium]MDY0050484.1 PAS domain-containing protein [Halothiobacillaceae bacterium]
MSSAWLEPGLGRTRGREFETLLDALAMPVFFKDTGLRLMRVNRAYGELLGRPTSELVGLRAGDLFPAELAERCDEEDRLVLAQGEARSFPDRLMAGPQGGLQYFSIYKAPMRDDSGAMVGLVGFATDVTERRLAEAERLTALQQQRDALVQEVHHRIKNHLQGVAGLLHRSMGAHPALAGPLRGVLAQVESIAGIHGLQSRQGTQQLNPGEVIAMIAQLAQEPVDVHCEGIAACLSEEDAVPFALTLNELISNALKHRDAVRAEPVRVHAYQDDRGLWVEILNAPARLPPGFDFAARQGLGTGLRLVGSLLPSEGASLGFEESGGRVRTCLHIQAVRLPSRCGP